MKPVQNIFLIGYMGSGKTTMGRRLADSMNWSFVDLDEQIENQVGLSVAEIFEQKGEPEFRKIEASVLGEVSKSNNQIVATGGGTPMHSPNLHTMQQSGLVVYLQASTEELKRRLLEDGNSRPLLRDKSDALLETFITDHLKSRIPVYEKADVVFETSQGVAGLIEILRDYSR